jgi:hypothetical protein
LRVSRTLRKPVSFESASISFPKIKKLTGYLSFNKTHIFAKNPNLAKQWFCVALRGKNGEKGQEEKKDQANSCSVSDLILHWTRLDERDTGIPVPVLL